MISAPAHLIRLGRAGFVFAREGVFGAIDPVAVPPAARPLLRVARLIERPTRGGAEARLSAALTRLGPSYVKLGQFLATRPDVVGAAFAHDLERLQDQMPAIPQKDAEAAIAASFGKPIRSIFESFGPPVAAASIAQVHRAEVDDSRAGGAPSPSRCCGPASSGAFTPTCAPSPLRRSTPKAFPPRRDGCA